MIKYSVIIGIGGTGAKIVEAVIQLAASGNAPQTIYPVLIDQDTFNANVTRCKNSIQKYKSLKERIGSIHENDIIFRSKIIDKEFLLPLAPVSLDSNFSAAVGYEQMGDLQRDVVESLFNRSQLYDKLDYGYKKRAHMGAALINRMILNEEQRDPREDGLKSLISEIKGVGEHECQIVVCGSLFGGTGASGIIKVGEYFSEKLPNFVIKGLLMLPYFKVSKKFRGDDQDAGLVQSDNDMHAVKIALEMYKDQIEKAFDHVYLLGTDNPPDLVTSEAVSGGREQKNPAHIFEALGSIVTVLDNVKSPPKSTIFHRYIFESPSRDKPGVYAFDFEKISSSKATKTKTQVENRVFDVSTLKLMRDFSNLMVQTEHLGKGWKGRQPWYIRDAKWSDSSTDETEGDKLLNWARRHNDWWWEMSGTPREGRKWEKFYFKDEITIKPYKLSGLLTMYLKKNQSEAISDIVTSLNRIARKKY